MKTLNHVVVVLSALLSIAIAKERFDLMRVSIRGPQDIEYLEQSGCVVNGLDRDGVSWLVEVPTAKEQALATAGYGMETLMPDIYGFYERNALDYRFHTYTQLKDSFMIMAQNNPSFVRFETLGFASNDSLLFALKITDNPDVEEDEPELMFEAAAHGDEKCATEPAFEWAVYLIRNYGVDPDVTYWVNTREIWVQCPTNPYGHIVGDRTNRNGYDINRDYGFMWYYENSGTQPFTQLETQAQLRLFRRNCFNLWQSGHGGTYCISTPWSYTPFGTRDSMELQYLALQYHNITGYDYGPGYRVMYQINGASKDYAYGAGGGIGWTIETCIYKTPPAESLAQICAREHTAMKMALRNIDRGIRGIITDSVTAMPIRARVKPMPIDYPSFSDSIGDYHRYLRPGTYSVTFEANGYSSKTVNNVVVTQDTVTYLDVRLAPDTTQPVTLHQFVAGRGVSDVAIASTPDLALGLHDGRRFSMGRGGMATYDFGQQIFNLGGNDFTVYEDDADPEGYRVEVANDWSGPWNSLGSDTGTAGFDLTRGGIPTCRFVKVVDDSGSTSGATAGFDLDAIEAVTSNAAAVVYQGRTILDSPPGGNNNGKLDPGEDAGLVLTLKNVGRQPAADVNGVLSTADQYVSVLDSFGVFGTLAPDSVRSNSQNRFRVAASAGTPREHVALMKLNLYGTGYEDSLQFQVVVGELTAADPIPDGPRQPPLYWAYDDVDSMYPEHPTYDWVEIGGLGTRLTLSDDQTVVVSLPTGFGPFRFYGQNYTQVSVCGNGWVAPGSTTVSAYSNTALPTSALPGAVCLNWDDLYPPTGGGVWYYHDAANHRFIVEFDSVPYYANRTACEKHEVVLYDTSLAAADGNCEFVCQYKTALGMSSSTSGEQDPSQSIAITVLSDGAYHRAAAPIAAGRAIRYTTDFYQGVAEATSAIGLQSAPLRVLPNPWGQGRLTLAVRLGRAAKARVAVYDAGGRLVRVLLNWGTSMLAAGQHNLSWDGRDHQGKLVGRGVHLVRLESEGRVFSAKAVRTR